MSPLRQPRRSVSNAMGAVSSITEDFVAFPSNCGPDRRHLHDGGTQAHRKLEFRPRTGQNHIRLPQSIPLITRNMNPNGKSRMNTPGAATACRWSARIISTLLIGVIAAMAIGEGMPNPFTHALSPMERLGFAGLALIVLGFLAGWRWELAGGIASIVGVCMVFGPTMVNGRITLFIAALLVPGALYMASHLLRCGPPKASDDRPRSGEPSA